MYFDGDWDATLKQGAVNLSRFLVRRGVQMDAEYLAETFLIERQAGFEQASRTGREVTCAQVIQAILTRAGVRPEMLGLVPQATRVYFELEEVPGPPIQRPGPR